MDVVSCRVTVFAGRKDGLEETLFITREHQYLSHAPEGTTLEEFARVAKAAREIEACFKQAKGEAGMADYQVRNWIGWHHHQTLALMATWFLSVEARRGEKETPALTVPLLRDVIASLLAEKLAYHTSEKTCWRVTQWMRRTETARFYWHGCVKYCQN